MKDIGKSRLIVCGIVRDAEHGLRTNIPVIDALCRKFGDWKVVVFENDSKDATKSILREWAATSSGHVHAICSDADIGCTIPKSSEVTVNPFFSRRRIEKMCRLRNQYLEYLEKQGWDADYLIVADLDVASISLDGILSSFDSAHEWDSVTAFGYSTSPRLKRRYHDTYALTKWGEDAVPQTEEMTIRYADELGNLKPSHDWIRVYSAFGGLAIYRFEAIKGLRYSVLDNADPMVEVRSEHVGLYKAMIECGFDRIFINPAMRIHYQRVTLAIAWRSLCRKIDKLFNNRRLASWGNKNGAPSKARYNS